MKKSPVDQNARRTIDFIRFSPEALGFGFLLWLGFLFGLGFGLGLWSYF